jgi:hypothetical protein
MKKIHFENVPFKTSHSDILMENINLDLKIRVDGHHTLLNTITADHGDRT